MGGTLFPALTEATSAHVLHRWVAAVVGVVVVAVAVVAWRTQRDRPTLVRLAVGAAVLYAIQVVVGGLQVLTGLSGWSQTLHLGLGAIIFALYVGLAVTSFYAARTTPVGTGRGADAGLDDPVGEPGTKRTTRDSIRAYIALTKPRIIELCSSRPSRRWSSPRAGCPGIDWGDWGRLVGLDAGRRHARRGQRQRHQLLSRPRHRRAHDPDASAPPAGPPGRARARGRSSGSCSASCRSS